jgi:limonene-1,2-epoxide hydrolase
VVVGLQEIGVAVAGFFAAIASSRHQLLDIWSAGGAVGCEGEVTYTRHDGWVATFPFANVFKLRGNKIASYRIYIDISSLFTVSE